MKESRLIQEQRERSKLQGSRPAKLCTTISEQSQQAKETLEILERQDVWDALELHNEVTADTETLRSSPPFNNATNKLDVDKIACPTCKMVPTQPCIYTCGHLTCEPCFEGEDVYGSVRTGHRKKAVTKFCPVCAKSVDCVPLENPRDCGRTPSKKGQAAIEVLMGQQQYPLVLAEELNKVVHPESTRVDQVRMNATREEDFKATSIALLVGKETVTDGLKNSQGQLPVDQDRTEVTIDGVPVPCDQYRFQSPTSMTVEPANGNTQFEMVLDATKNPDLPDKGGFVFAAPSASRAIARYVRIKGVRPGKIVLLCEVIHGPELQSAPFKSWLALTTHKKDMTEDVTMLDMMWLEPKEQTSVACMPTPLGAKVYWASNPAALEDFCKVMTPAMEDQHQDVDWQPQGSGWHTSHAQRHVQ